MSARCPWRPCPYVAADDADLDTHLREVGDPLHQPQGHHTTDEVLRALVRTELAWMLHHLRGEFASLGSTAGLVAQITITVDPDEIPEPAPRPVGPETVAT